MTTSQAWEQAQAASRIGVTAPLPVRLRPHGTAAFVGREGESGTPARMFDTAASSGERRAAFVLGEPGIGKTRLVSEVAATAHRDGAVVLAGRCDEGLDLPYQPFVEALEHLVAHAPEALLEQHVQEYGDLISRLVPALARRVPSLAAPPRGAVSESARYLLYNAIEGMFAASADAQPLLVVLEDLHWADRPTVTLLRRLLTSPHAAGMAFACTCRASQLGASEPLWELLADLHREDDVVRLELDGLQTADVAELLRELAPEQPTAGQQKLAESLRTETDGNPFFITELVQNLAETGALVRARGGWKGTGGAELISQLPVSITETLRRRISRLGPDAERCLSTAAVIGSEFSLELLDSLTGVHPVADVLDRALGGGLLVDAGAMHFRFAHALVQRYLYGQLGPVRRAELHRQIGTALEQRLHGGQLVSAAELAQHWVAGAGDDVAQPLRYAALAGDEALAKLAPDEALRWYATALGLLERQDAASEHQRCDLLIRRGEAERLSGDPAFRHTLLEAATLAEELGDEDALVRVVLANTRGMQSETGIVDEDRIRKLDAALALVGEQDSPQRARLLATQAAELMYSGEWERRTSLSDNALEIARRLGDWEALTTVLNMRYVTLLAPESHAERLANSEEAITAALKLTDPLAQFFAYHWRVGACIESGDILAAQEWMTRERAVADRLRQPTALWLSSADEANLALIQGRLADAERLTHDTFKIGQASEPDALACFTAQLTCLAFERGILGDSVPLLEQAVGENPGVPGFRSTLALALCAAGREDEGRPIIAIDAASNFQELADDVTWLAVACIFGHVSTKTKNLEAAEALYDLLGPWRNLIAYPYFGVWGSVEHYLGGLALTLGNLEAADIHLTAAAAVNRRVVAPTWGVRTDLHRARLLEARGDTVRSRELLALTLHAARELGCASVVREIERST